MFVTGNGQVYATLVNIDPLPSPLVHDAQHDLPVLLSVAHSGRVYPDWLVELSSGGRRSLETLEDPLVDCLAARAIAAGTGAVIARAPRAAIDCNRSEHEIDPTVITAAAPVEPGPRARGGLGIVPGRTIHEGPLWRKALSYEEFQSRLERAHRPYHCIIAMLLERLRMSHDAALLLDCHSMPARPDGHPGIVIGDRYGRSASHHITVAAEAIVRDEGLSVHRNAPYAGGWIVERHGKPARNVHALQIEVDRSLYLAPDMRTPGKGFDRIGRLIERLALELGGLLGTRSAQAAE